MAEKKGLCETSRAHRSLTQRGRQLLKLVCGGDQKMKKHMFVLSLATPMNLTAQQRERRHVTETTANANPRENYSDSDLPEKDEFHQSYQLAAGAKVDVKGINGSVDIETAQGSTAQVNIYRSARIGVGGRFS